MKLFHALFSEFLSRWDIVRSKEKKSTIEQKIFAMLEIVCFPVSMLTIALLLVQVILAACGVHISLPPFWGKYISPVLLAGAVGYLTNWLAIIMLFRPYDPVKWFFVWPQGMIPRNKDNIAKVFGRQVGSELLSPEEIAEELSGCVVLYLRRPNTIKHVKSDFQEFMTEHLEEVTAFLVPKIQKTLCDAIEGMVTPDKVKSFLEGEILPWIKAPENRTMLAEKLIVFLQGNASGLSNRIQQELSTRVNARVNSIPGIGLLLGPVIQVVMRFFADQQVMKDMLSNWLADKNTQILLEEEVVSFANRFNDWLNTEEANQKLKEFSDSSKTRLNKMVKTYLETSFPEILKKEVLSDSLWNVFETRFYPSLTLKISEFISSQRAELVEFLNLPSRIEKSITKMKIPKFHKWINAVVAEHLGAIQVLGFVLGIIVGCLQLIQTSCFN